MLSDTHKINALGQINDMKFFLLSILEFYTKHTSQLFFAEVDDGTFMDDARKDWTADDYLEMDSENDMSDNQVSLPCVYYSLEIVMDRNRAERN